MTEDQIQKLTEVVMDEWYDGSFTDRRCAKEVLLGLIRDVVDIEAEIDTHPEILDAVIARRDSSTPRYTIQSR